MKSIITRFEEKVSVGPDCWKFIGSHTKDGHCFFWNGKKEVLAHRFAWEYMRGTIPEGIRVLHKCDNPCCVNIDHLFLGTDADNVADRQKKNRQAKGESIGCSKLTEQQVREMRKMYKEGSRGGKHGGTTFRTLAALFNVDHKTIWLAVRKKKWAHVKETA